MKQSTIARRLQNKADQLKDDGVVLVILKTDISGLNKWEASQKLKNAIEDYLENVG